jgi:hypothetical protein
MCGEMCRRLADGWWSREACSSQRGEKEQPQHGPILLQLALGGISHFSIEDRWIDMKDIARGKTSCNFTI